MSLPPVPPRPRTPRDPSASTGAGSSGSLGLGLPLLGAGLGYREPYRSDLFLHRGRVDFLEIVADHFFAAPPEKERELALLAEHFTLIPHGLDLSLGTAEGLDLDYLDQLAALIASLNPPWWSEHLAFTRAGGVQIGHLTPLPFTREAIEVLCRNIAVVQERIRVPLLLENISFSVRLPGAEMSEAAFIREVVDRTGCGLLLDVTNLYTNSANHGYDPIEFLDSLPLDRVVQLHFTGGYQEEGQWIDSHSEPTPPEVWSLLRAVCERAPVRGVVLERDENLPPFEELLDEVGQARSILQSVTP